MVFEEGSDSYFIYTYILIYLHTNTRGLVLVETWDWWRRIHVCMSSCCVVAGKQRVSAIEQVHVYVPQHTSISKTVMIWEAVLTGNRTEFLMQDRWLKYIYSVTEHPVWHTENVTAQPFNISCCILCVLVTFTQSFGQLLSNLVSEC
jgi:hypothetical protein